LRLSIMGSTAFLLLALAPFALSGVRTNLRAVGQRR
jgi:hypothetical protein